MGKHKKKHSKKDSVSDDLLDATVLSIKKFRQVTNEIAKLSTGQKIVGGLVVMAAGYFYWDKLRNDARPGDYRGAQSFLPRLLAPAGADAPAPPTAADDDAEQELPPRKAHKHGKGHKGHGGFGRKPAAAPDDDL